MKTLFRRLLHVLRWSRHDADLREEIEAHRTLRQAALERDGFGPDDAAQASRGAMGNVTLAVEDARDVWGMRVLDGVRQDVRAAVRGLRKSAGFSVVVIGTLALGIRRGTAPAGGSGSSHLVVRPNRSPSGGRHTRSSCAAPWWRPIDRMRSHSSRKEQNGYIVNSLIVPWCTAALDLLVRGVSDFESIDRTWMIAWQSGMGPCGMMDRMGLGVVYRVAKLIGETTPNTQALEYARYVDEHFIQRGRLGVATGQGFYSYPISAFPQPGFIGTSWVAHADQQDEPFADG
jgi:hypothetical protein